MLLMSKKLVKRKLTIFSSIFFKYCWMRSLSRINQAIGQEAEGRNSCTGSSIWTWPRNFSLRRWVSTGTDCPEGGGVSLTGEPSGHSLCHVLWDDLVWAGSLDQMTSCGAFQPGPFWDSVWFYTEYQLQPMGHILVFSLSIQMWVSQSCLTSKG